MEPELDFEFDGALGGTGSSDCRYSLGLCDEDSVIYNSICDDDGKISVKEPAKSPDGVVFYRVEYYVQMSGES